MKKTRLAFQKIFLSILIFQTVIANSLMYAQDTHPHILVKPQDKQIILDKIEKHEWAKKSFDKMVVSVAPYVEKHKTDTEWILSRYLMNRVPGKRYTKFFSDQDGTALVRYEGDAPVPTIRVSPHKRPPITKEGYSYKMPSFEELVPYDTSMKMYLQSNAPGGKKEWVDPQTFVENINGKINELALNAAILYWLTAKEEYARFAADILTQWARGASYQNPIEGPCRTGFLSIQTLGDGHYEPMPLIYDFLYVFLRDRSANAKSNEYVYHNIGNDVQLLDEQRNPVQTKGTVFPVSQQPFDPPGFRLIQDYKTTGKTSNNLIALFSLKEAGDDKYMQLLFTGEVDREFYTGKGPQSGTADIPYRTMSTPTLINRQIGDAWKRPFVCIYEPFSGKNNFTVERIENSDRSGSGTFTALTVFNKDGSRQIILQAIKKEQVQEKNDWKFKGSFGVISIEKSKPAYLYIGEGSYLSYQKYAIETGQLNGSANLVIDGNKLQVTCHQGITVRINDDSIKAATLIENGNKKEIPITKTGTGLLFTVPAMINGEILIN